MEQFKIADIAKELNVSRPTIVRLISKLDSELDFKSKYVHVQGTNRTSPMLIDKEGFDLLASRIETHSDNTKSDNVSPDMIKILTEQLAAKDKQIASMQAQIDRHDEETKDFRDLLKGQAAELIQLRTAVQAIEHAGTTDNADIVTEEHMDVQADEQHGDSIWSRLFGRK